MAQFRFPPPTGKSATLLGLDLAPQIEDYTLPVNVTGDLPVAMPNIYQEQAVAPLVTNIQEPNMDQDFSQLQGYQKQLGTSPALRQSEYDPSTLRRILAGLGGGAAGYQGGPLAGIQTGETILDTPYRRAMQRYHDSLEPYAAGAKAELEKYGKDIDYYGKSTIARKQAEDINRDRAKERQKETELYQSSVGKQAEVGRLRAYEKDVTGRNTQILPGTTALDPSYQNYAIDKLNPTDPKATGVKPRDPLEMLNIRMRAAKERAQIMSNFNVTSQQLRIAELGATQRVQTKHPEFNRFFNKETGMPEWTGGEQAGAEWLAYQDALRQHQAEVQDIIGTVKSKSGRQKNYIGRYEFEEEP